ncbi:maker5 [Drosophila busckii]|uniref:Maker5 n=1 Tax=Drosophila busckii TaxID=30019 RepID=A0A0M5J6Q8_DROBS|nr:maker5 [Drosophila busckii]
MQGAFISGLISLALCACLVTVESRFNISFAQLDSCNSYEIESSRGYSYKDSFMVHTMDNNNIEPNQRLHLKFYVLTSMDAHILLSVTSRPRPNDRVYEIVIGAGGNTFSAIRTSMGLRRVSTNQDPHLLSMYDPTPVEIIQTKEGDLYVYIPGFKKEPLLHFMDASALNINYISFSSFGTNSARWFYDCAFDGYSTEMEKEKRQLTVQERLMNALNDQGQNSSLPAKLSGLSFNFQMRSLTYEPANAMLRTRLQLLLHWQDPRLTWKPENYNNMTYLVHKQLEIWTPELLVLNGAWDSMGNVLKSYELRVYADGNVTLMVNNLELNTWYTQRPLAPNEHVNTLSGWTFVEIGVTHLENAESMRYSPEGLRQSMHGDMAIEFTLQRNGSFYRHVFVMPLAVCQIFIVLSFLLRGYRRGALILITLMLTAWGLIYLTRHASPHYVPQLMVDYQHVMRISVYCYLLHIAIMWLRCYPPRSKAPAWILAVINCPALRLVLGMRFSYSTDYGNIQDQPWRQVAKMLNNASLLVINIIFIVLDVRDLSSV